MPVRNFTHGVVNSTPPGTGVNSYVIVPPFGARRRGLRMEAALGWRRQQPECQLPSPICFMNSPLSQNRYSSNMMPSLFQRPMVAIGIRYAFPVGSMVFPSGRTIGLVNVPSSQPVTAVHCPS